VSVYRKTRAGFDKLAPDEVEDQWNGRGLARFTPPARRHETVATKRAVECGWDIPPELKTSCLEAVAAVLADRLADHRERLAAVACVAGMVKTNALIDAHAAGDPGGDPTPAVIRVEYVDEAADPQTD